MITTEPGEAPEPPQKVDVLVYGSTLAQLTVALECVSVGLSVVILKPEKELLENTFRASQPDPDGVVAELIEKVARPLKETEQPEISAKKTPPPQLYARVKNKWLAAEPASVYGIPSSPLASQNSALLGLGGAFRAYLDRLKPVLTIGKTRVVADLVHARVGQKVLQRLVTPQLRHKYGFSPNEVDVAVVMPGLNETITRTGSLTGAVLAYAERYETLESKVEPDCGWAAFATQMLNKITLLGGIVTSHGEQEYEARALVKTKIRSDGLKRAHAIAEIDTQQDFKDNSLATTAWHDENGQWFSAAIYVEAERSALEVRSETSDAPQAISDEVVQEALNRTATTLIADKQVIRFVADAEPATETQAQALEATLNIDGLSGQTDEPLTVECLIDTSELGLSRSIRDATSQAVLLRRLLLGIITTNY